MKLLKKLGKALLVLIAVVAVALAAYKVVADGRFYADYDPNLPFSAEVAPAVPVDETIEVFGLERTKRFRRIAFSFEARLGERVPGLMAMPMEPQGKVPVILFLHGAGQRKEFIDEIATPFVDAGFAMVSFDQLLCGERKVEESKLAEARDWRNRAWKTVNDTRRLVDYLETWPELDSERIYLTGASYGAITGTVVLAKEKRIKAGALVVGGGNISTMLDAPLIQEHVPPAVLMLGKQVVKYFVGAADPVRHAALTAGTPVLMQNGSEDTLVSPEAGEALYAALGDPKEIRWYPIDHPGLRKTDGPQIIQLLNDTRDWLLEQDAPYRTAAAHAAPAAHTPAK